MCSPLERRMAEIKWDGAELRALQGVTMSLFDDAFTIFAVDETQVS